MLHKAAKGGGFELNAGFVVHRDLLFVPASNLAPRRDRLKR
jgi:hypothetical protein